MSRGGIIFLVILAAVGGAAAGYWYGRSPTATRDSPPLAEATAAEAERNILYYRDPSGAPYWSATPKKDDQGRDYLPVYDDEPSSAASKPAARSSSAGSKPSSAGSKRIRYYRNPMGLPDTSPVPKKDSMGMDYIPVYEGDDEDDGNTVKVSLDRIQRSGVRIEKVQLRTVVRAIRAPGIVRINERKLSVVTLRVEGYIEQLHVNTTGDTVKAGQPLFRLYSAPLVQAQLEYALAMKAARTGHDVNQMALVDGAAQKLRSLGMPEARIREIQQSGTVSRTIEWPAPAGGTVLEKKVIDGQRVMAGDELYRIADLSTVWVIAEVPERDIGSITLGSTVTVTFRAFPSQPVEGRVTFIYPELKAETRTARVRIELPNPDGRLRPDMYADVVFHEDSAGKPVVAVPDSAVIDSGTRKLVLISKGEGRFEPRVIKTGRHGDGYLEVLEGVKEGEEVVTSATFLIDAESNLRAALKGFTEQESQK
jgi:Cu(I)/Ag(I) efflux system membrane fusion protein